MCCEAARRYLKLGGDEMTDEVVQVTDEAQEKTTWERAGERIGGIACVTLVCGLAVLVWLIVGAFFGLVEVPR